MSNATVLRHMDMLFPSPVGELHFSIIMAKKQYTIIKSFPSPVGELHFSISSSFVVVEVDSCFSPLSGNYISQLKAKYDLLKMAGWFPSPVGELHFSIVGLQLMKTVKDVSVPCRGTTFLNGQDSFLYP